MAQNPLAATVTVNPAGQQTPQHADAFGNVRVDQLPALTVLDITAATVVKAGAGRIGTVNMIVPGSANGTVNDCLTTAQINVTNQIAVLTAFATAQIQPIKVDMMFTTGLVVAPGTGQTVAVSYE